MAKEKEKFVCKQRIQIKDAIIDLIEQKISISNSNIVKDKVKEDSGL